jgi:Uma2 family endonuclease
MPVQTRSLFEIIAALPAGSMLLLHKVHWAEYEALLALLPDNPRLRLSYAQGTLEIMTLSPRHERLKSLFTHLLAMLAEALNRHRRTADNAMPSRPWSVWATVFCSKR